MLYFEFPSVSDRDRLARAAALEVDAVRVGPADAFDRLGWTIEADEVTLTSFLDRPAYHFRGGGEEGVVYADTGAVRGEPSAGERAEVAARWAGRPEGSQRVEEVRDVDQWTVAGRLRTLRPLWRHEFNDGQQVYVAGVSGDVVQHTTRRSRLGAYLGPIPHWFYFTPLRKHPVLWSRFVIGVSAVGTLVATSGLISAVLAYRRRRFDMARTRRKPSAMRWHLTLGSVFGVGAVTWALSGMLSMDPFPWSPAAASLAPRLAATLRQPPRLSRVDLAGVQRVLRAAGSSVREMQFIHVANRPAAVVRLGDAKSGVLTLDTNEIATLDQDALAKIIAAGLGNDIASIEIAGEYDSYYYERLGRAPLPVLRVAAKTGHRYYVDPASARLVGAYEGNWVDRWLYDGLHTLSVPGLSRRPLLRRAVVMFFMVGGVALSLTSVWLSWRVLWRTFRPPVRQAP